MPLSIIMICGIFIISGLIITCIVKDPVALFECSILAAFVLLIYGIHAILSMPVVPYEKTFVLKELEKDNYYKISNYNDGLYTRAKVTVRIVDNEDISHIETFNCEDLKIEYSTLATEGQITIKYGQRWSKEESATPYLLDEIILRLPETIIESSKDL